MKITELTPFVYWSQTDDTIKLKLEITNISEQDIKIDENLFTFFAYAKGYNGYNNYIFQLAFSYPIKSYKIVEHAYCTEIFIEKDFKQKWSSITKDAKPTWLKVNFEDWSDSEDDKLKEEFYDNDMNNYMEEYKSPDEIVEWQTYNTLLFYDSFIFVCYLTLCIKICYQYLYDPIDFKSLVYQKYHRHLLILQILPIIFESLYALYNFHSDNRFVRYKWYHKITEILHRICIQFFCLELIVPMQSKPIVFNLYLVWILDILLRYPYYMSCSLCSNSIPDNTESQTKYNSNDRSNSILYVTRWLRYTVWIPVYFLCFMIESVSVLRAASFYKKSEVENPTINYKLQKYMRMDVLMEVYTFFMLIGMVYTIYHVFEKRKRIFGTIWDFVKVKKQI